MIHGVLPREGVDDIIFLFLFLFFTICSDVYIYTIVYGRQTRCIYLVDEREGERLGLISEIAACIRTCEERGGSTVESGNISDIIITTITTETCLNVLLIFDTTQT